MAEQTATVEECVNTEIKGETWEVIQYLAMALKADNEGRTEVAQTLRSIAMDEAAHGSRFKYLAGNIGDLKDEIGKMLAGEEQAYDGKHEGMKTAETAGQKEMASWFDTAAHDEARHAAMLRNLLERYF
ncbi:MAG: rubrerythrin family protein [Actinomycetota bacterium]|jgi:rubrerythrin|nr:rubrerythrin family protein [Actinomycetota bacterium]MDA8167554.1 rubrerythrin family protein [Actinomycetota bacterium]